MLSIRWLNNSVEHLVAIETGRCQQGKPTKLRKGAVLRVHMHIAYFQRIKQHVFIDMLYCKCYKFKCAG